MTKTFERALDEMNLILGDTDICEDAFNECAKCVCTTPASNMYFSRVDMQWYPGDDPDFDVDGYEEYIDYIVEHVADKIADYYGVDVTDELKDDVQENLLDIDGIYVLDEEDFCDKAIEDYCED